VNPAARQGSVPGRGFSGFHAATVVVLGGYCASVAVLFVADAWYADLASFKEALSSQTIRQALVLSLVTSVISTVVAVVVAVPSAYALSRLGPRWAMLPDTLVDASIVLPPLVIGISLLVVYRMSAEVATSQFGPLRRVGTMLKTVGEFFIYNRPGIVLAQVYCSTAYAIRVIKASFDAVDRRCEAVALTLGCTRTQVFRTVTLPLARSGILAGAVLAWARALGIFGPIMIVAGAVRGHTEVLPTSAYLEISIGHIEAALAIALIMVAVAVTVLLIFRAVTRATIFGTGGVR